MPDLTPRERLQPALLDRLTDREPSRQMESRDERVINAESLRESVLRDLQWLFNTSPLEQVQSLEDHPLARSSVVNYGMPNLSGRTLNAQELGNMQQRLRACLLTFEPRLLPESLRVEVVIDTESHQPNAVVFNIDAQLWADPIPLQLYLQTEVDLDTGSVKVIPKR